jgi:anaerobic magnesium-protoporphyrin IX monomethyl ester cyclase
MLVALINPNLVVQKSDPFTTGIVYMPISLAYLAETLRAAGHAVKVIDSYGNAPRNNYSDGSFVYYGLSADQLLASLPQDLDAIFVYAINLTNHLSTIAIVRAIKQKYPKIPLIILENTQAVTAYALSLVKEEFFQAGADYVLTGEPEKRALRLLAALNGDPTETPDAIDGLGTIAFYNPPIEFQDENELNALPFPAWDLFPLDNYWSLRFAHGPFSSRRYLPLLTSRGCPYPCGFCVVPTTNRQKWRPRSATNVVDEMEHFGRTLGVYEFHIEDLDPTIIDSRTRDICNEILRRDLKVIWKIAAGTKVETMRDEDTIDLMAKTGCRYISISPETGSPRLLKLMRKPFDLGHAIRLVKRMSKVGIRSQACFVLGYPGETDEDLQMTRNLVRELTRVGVDEIALFVVTPVPGSSIFNQFSGYKTLSELNFSPSWRKDYSTLSRFRARLYIQFLFWKLRYHPIKLLQQPINFFRRRFETKMEMTPYRALVLRWLAK